MSGSVSVWSCSGEFTSPRGGVKPPLRQTETLPYAEVAILANEGGQLLSNYRDFADYYGANKLLADLHWPYDVVSAGLLKSSELASYPLLLVPNVEYLSAEDRQTVLEYVEKGGHLFFCGHCAVFDQNGKPHAAPNFGFVEISQETRAPRGYSKTSFYRRGLNEMIDRQGASLVSY